MKKWVILNQDRNKRQDAGSENVLSILLGNRGIKTKKAKEPNTEEEVVPEESKKKKKNKKEKDEGLLPDVDLN